MTDRRAIRERLEREPIPGEREAEERAWEVVRAAYTERSPTPATARYGRVAAALAGAAALAALVLSPAGADVREWISDVVEPGVKNAEPVLTSLPAPGKLLVESEAGPWVVSEDGAARLLGDYEQAAFSPTGRFVAAGEGRHLSAVVADSDLVGEPAGTVRWRVTAPARVRDPAWAPSGVRVAYRAGEQLRLVAGDATWERGLATDVAPVAPVWRPLTEAQERSRDEFGVVSGVANVLAYVDADRRIHVVSVGDERAGSARELVRPRSVNGAPIRAIEWARNGRDLFALTDHGIVGVTVRDRRLAPGPSYGFGGAEPVALATSPRLALELAAVTRRSTESGETRSKLWHMVEGGVGSPFTGPGRLTGVAWSPNGRWLLVAWRDADQWLFIRPGGGKPTAIDGISEFFASGEAGATSFPRIAGWCCGR
jgi:WD40-like Beta Propeller Repeat